MVFRRGGLKQNNELEVIIDNNEINKVACTKSLGVIVDKNKYYGMNILHSEKKS